MSRTNIENIYPLSPMQEGLLFHTLYATEAGVYLVQIGWTLRGELDQDAFRRAWQELVDRHSILRTAFVWEKLEKPMQLVRARVTLPFEDHDLRGLSPAEQELRIQQFLDEDRRKGFDLTRAPLMRIALLRLADDAVRFVWSRHHLLLDGWSTPLLVKEVFALYEAFAEGRAARLERPRPYGEYIAWLQKQDLGRAELFWRDQLKGFSAPTPFGVDHAVRDGGPPDEPGSAPKPPGGGDAKFGDLRKALSEDVSAAAQAFCRKYQLTASTLVQAAWALLLSRYSGEGDVVFGSTVSGRSAPVPGIEKMVGLFINTLPVRVAVDPEARVAEWVTSLQRLSAELRDYEQSPLVEVQGWSAVPRGTALFESLVVFENYPVEQEVRKGMGKVSITDARTIESANYPLTLLASYKRTLTLQADYDTRRFDEAAIRRMLDHLGMLLERMVGSPDARLCEISPLTAAERQTLLVEWNATSAPFPRDACLHQMFEAQVDRTPDALALVFEHRRLTYRELDQRANRLANHLSKLGVGPEVLVGLCLERSIDTLVGIVGILKAGGAYVPMDPAYPRERLAFTIEDSRAPVLVTERAVLPVLPAHGARTVLIDGDWPTIEEESDARPVSGVRPDNLAYTLFTSGSTGRPKGVAIEHHSPVALVCWAKDVYGPEDWNRTLFSTSVCFDLSIFEMFVPLSWGGAVIVAKNALELPTIPAANEVTLVNTVPSAMAELVRSESVPASVRTVNLAGEPLGHALAQQIYAVPTIKRLLNLYGPTEDTTYSTFAEGKPETGLAPPIGRPLSNGVAYILDAHLAPVPIGVPAELYLGGEGLARGYLHRPELTAERFIQNPFGEGRLYKTGDLIRYTDDGTLEYVGRIDHQVKVRGFRIELGEIETVLSKHPSLRGAVVMVREDTPNDKRLVAYLVLGEGKSIVSNHDLRLFVKEKLPDFMVPSAFVTLEALPMTPNGKVDRKALPAPELGASASHDYTAPRGPVEEALVSIFGEVLKLDPGQISAHDSFFELGGHSLLVTQAAARIRGAFGVELPLRAMFDAPTPAELAPRVQAALGAGAGLVAPPLTRVPRTGPLPLSFAQERLWFLDQLEPGDPSYIVPQAIRLEGALDIGALERTVQEIVRRHEMLRTTYATVAGRPVQVIHDRVDMALPVTRWPGLPAAEREEALRRELAAELQRPFDLAAGPVVRARLFEVGDEDHVLYWTMHHVVSDAWSKGVLNREIAAIYDAFRTGNASPLAELPIQYADFATWQRGFLQGDAMGAELDYWKKQLEGAPRVLELPTDRPRPPVQSPRGEYRAFAISADVTKVLKELSRREGATLFMTLLAAFDVLLSRYTGQGDIVVGTPIAGRTQAETEQLVGFFINTLVLRTTVTSDGTFRDLVHRVRETCLGAYAHQDMPFERLVQELDPERDLSRSPLFQVMFSLQNTPRDTTALPGLRRRPIGVENTSTKFDITLALSENEKGLVAVVEYKTDLFDRPTIDRMLGHYATLLEAVAKGPQKKLSELSILPADERRRLVIDWNDTAAELPAEGLIHELFEAQAQKTPDAVAVVFGEAKLTYRELDRRANQLANYAQKMGVGPGVLVALCVSRSIEMAVGILGILKAGGAYVPMDPTYPPDRIALMLEDCEAPVVLTQEKLADELPLQTGILVLLDAEREIIAAEPSEKPPCAAAPTDTAYVIYTSGSTGKPKGVVVAHQNLVCSTAARLRHYTRPVERFLVVSSFAFDSSVAGIFWTLVQGGTVVLPPDSYQEDPSQLLAIIAAERVSHVLCVPSLYAFLLAGQKHGELGSLTVAIVAGETAPPELVARHFDLLPEAQLFNEYGPTEATVWCSVYEAKKGESHPRVPIGKPIPNARLYILDAAMQPAPIGIAGELYVGGLGVTRGYFKRPELTAEKFVANPFSPDPEALLYRTGDLARFLPSGDVDFLGRIDHQVKIRGYRIELGEIEAALAQHAHVDEAVVIACEDTPGDKRLVGYVVSEEKPGPSADDLKAFLAQRLPDYMVPRIFVQLPALPLTPNGKVDRKALPPPEARVAQGARVAPRNPIEQAVADTWAEVLDIEGIGAHDNFFDLGGHSLLATQVMGRLASALAVELPLHTLFEAPTVSGLAERVDAALRAGQGVEAPPLVRAARDRPLALSFGQDRLWFLTQLDRDDMSYVIPAAVRFEGPLDVGALERTLGEIVCRHEVLRTTFTTVEGRAVQVVHDGMDLTLVVDDLGPLPPEEREAAARRAAAAATGKPFDLTEGPLVRARLLVLGEADHVLLLTMHHIVSDAWSLGVFNHELSVIYAAFVEGRQHTLPELAVQYADYAEWQRGWLSGDVLTHHIDYWKKALGGAPHVLDLPTDRPRPAVATQHGARRAALYPPELLKKVKELSREEGVTLYMTLLSAFDVLLYRYTGQSDVLIGSPIAGRTRAETEGLIGFFINTLVLRAEMSEDMTFRELVQRTKGVSLGAYAHQDMPFERLVIELSPERDRSRSPLFQVLFTLQNAPHEDVALTGLSMRKVPAQNPTSKFDITMGFVEMQGGLLSLIEYKTDLFDAATIDRMLVHLRTLLEAAVAAPETRLRDLAILPADERRTLLVEWNATAADYPRDACAHELFEAQAARTPDATALVAGDAQLSYRELDARSNQLARYLQNLGVGPDTLVGLCVGRSIEMVVGVLGILKAGAAYVPLDPTYPVDRLAWMLEDSAVPVVVTEDRLADNLPVQSALLVRVDADREVIAGESADGLRAGATAQNLAYVIYTSGSTGKPKGVLIEHRGLVNYLAWAMKAYDVTSGRGAPVHSSIGFDLTVTGLFAPLVTGKSVTLLPEEREIEALVAALADPGDFSLVKLTPAHLEVLNQLVPEALAAGATRAFIIGGEALGWETVAFWRKNAPATRLINEYGPTETVVGCCVYDAARAGDFAGAVPIGKPIANTRLYVLDPWMQPAPTGVAGELYIGGDGVARGYLNRPELTAERFVESPFGDGRLYKTGDLARWLGTGDLEFLGRIDHQVKIRGFRIELGEIEAVLAQHAGVREAVALAREDTPGDKRLVAYVVADDDPGPSPEDLRAHLAERLPEYMVPTAFVKVAAMPLTPNGKVDRRALPAPEARGGLDGAYVAPRSAIEEELARIWAEVLDMERVSVADDFFGLGGHSLLATQVMGRIVTSLHVELPLHTLFESPTIAGLARAVEAALRGDHAEAPPIVRVSRGGALRLSFAQERLWFLTQLEPDSPFYNVASRHRLVGPLDADAFERALADVVRRHEVLRTTFATVDGRPVQILHDAADVRVPVVNLASLPDDARDEALREETAAEGRRPFDLATLPLLRAKLFRLGPEEHVLSLTMHHIVSDEVTRGVLNREITALYDAFSAGKPSPLPELPIQYADYAEWQRRWFEGAVFDRQLAYWKEQLRGAPAALDLPTDRPRPALQTYVGRWKTFTLAPDLTEGLRALARREGATLFMTLLAAFDVLLSRCSGQADIVVGTPAVNRTRPEIEGLVGLFQNTLVLRNELAAEQSFSALVARVRETCLGAYANQDMPFERLVQELSPVRDPSRSPIFQVLFTLQSAPAEAMSLQGIKLRGMGGGSATAKFDLSLGLTEGPKQIFGSLEYNTDLFEDATMDRMAEHLDVLLRGLVAAPARPIGEQPLLTEAERRLLLVDWNATWAPYPKDSCLHQMFEAQVDRTPDALALVFERRRFTYRELDQRANRLANHLRKLGVGPEVLVGLCLDRSADTLVGILGILKAGGAYVPMDPSYPRERLAFTIEDSRASVLVTARAEQALLPPHGARTVLIDEDWPNIEQESDERPASGVGPHDLAYTLFTSGSTGRPKGVAIEHHSPVALVSWAKDVYGPEDWSRTLFSTSVCFDLSIFEMFVPLSWGGAVIVAKNALELPTIPAANEVTLINTVPSAMAELVRSGSVPSSVRTVNLAGEALGNALARRIYAVPTIKRLLNLYGPTEDTTYSTFAEGKPETGLAPSIGRPLSNGVAYVLDARLEPVPIGVPAELYLGGEGLARGYLHRPDLTAERFIQSPFGEGRLYKTGDLVRYTNDGTLEYLGRIDHQVKIRGFRVELGEIEAVLSAHPSLREAVVIVREDGPVDADGGSASVVLSGDKRIVAYVVLGEGMPIVSNDDLRLFVKEKLPDFMVPSAFVTLEALPMTPNGKVDRKALPAPELGASALQDYTAPRGPIEEALVDIFADVLKLDPRQIGAHDGFFELGGHSLLAMRVVSRARAALGVELPLRAVFEAPTVAGLARHVDRALGASLAPAATIARIPRGGPIGLSFAQERLWLVDQLDPGSAAYNVPLAIRFEGALDRGALERALGEVVRRHEVLRTTFASVEGRPFAVVHDDAHPELPVIRWPALDLEARKAAARVEIEAEARGPFDLAAGPVIRVRLLEIADDDAILLVTMHHIASDGWSLGVLNREVTALYEAFAAGASSPLPELAIQYADYAAFQRAMLAGAELERHLAYWRKQLEGAAAAIDLPTDRPRPPVQTYAGDRRARVLAPELLRALEDLSRREGATLFMTLLAAFDVLLHRYTGQRDVVVGTPIAGRTRGEIEPLIGFFVDTLVLRATVADDGSFRALLARVREACLGAYAHQSMPFERLVQELSPQRDLTRTPLFQVMFVLQNGPADAMALTGVKRRRVEQVGSLAKFDLELALVTTSEGLYASFLYNTDLFDGATIERMLAHLEVLLRGIVARPDAPLWQLPILPEAERNRLLVEWNDTATDYPRDASIASLFEAQAASTPEATALVYGTERLTYRQLDERANRLAHHFRARGVGLEAPVGLLARRSLASVVAILAILKAGGAYVPLDPDHPTTRLAWTAHDAGITVLVSEGAPPEGAFDGATLVRLDADVDSIAAAPATPIVVGASGDSLAYVMYTSGSTGTPKGVCVVQRSVVRLVKSTGYARFAADDVLLELAPIAFDASTFEIWGALLNGATLVVHPPEMPSLEALGDVIRANGVTTMWLTAGLYNTIIDNHPQALATLKQLLTGGEALSVPHIQKGLAALPGVQLINGYGPTEGTTFTCCHAIESADGASIPIGRPIANTVVYVLDAHLAPAPIGVPGELYVGGDGLARGYLNRPDLDAERFVINPFGPGRLYRTGDLVRWLADGTIAFVGRLDHQVKIRGFRIELGEVEAVLGAHADVGEVVALAREDVPGDRRLVAYVVAAAGAKPTPRSLRAHLEGLLPAYMVPGAFVLLDAMPLTPNGKVDRRALPAPEAEGAAEMEAVAPRGPIEEALAAIFAEVLKVPAGGATTSFFELGGHSLLATQVIARVRATLGVELPLRALFEAPTPAALAVRATEALQAGRHLAAPPFERAPRELPLVLSFAQERLWFLDQLAPADPSYVIALAIRFKGALDRAALERALAELVRRHEVLRTTYAIVNGKPAQVVHDRAEVSVPITRVADVPANERQLAAQRALQAEARRPFDLASGPVLRARLVELSAEDHVLSLTMHHIVTDGWSVGVMNREIAVLYEAFSAGGTSPLPELPIQYADYAAWQRQWVTGAMLEQQLVYWHRQLAGAPPHLDLPTDRPRPPVESHRGARRLTTFPSELCAALRDLSRRESTTLYMTLLAAFDVLLARYSGQDDSVVGTPIANRTHAETEGLVGFFLNTLPLRVEVRGDEPFRALLQRVKEVCLGAYAHQDLPFERLVQDVAPERDLSRAPVFQVVFVLQNAPSAALALKGLERRWVDAQSATAKLDLHVALIEAEGGLGCSIEYATDLFDAATIDRLTAHYRALLEAIVRDPSARASELPLLGPDEIATLDRWNRTAKPYPTDATVPALFAAQAAQRPHGVAAVFEDQQLTYGDLDRRANRLAQHLQKLGVGPDVRVGLCLPRSLDLVVGILGILKAGGAYVPLDPTYPVERLAYMLEDSAVPVVVTEERLADDLPAQTSFLVRLDADRAAIEAETDADPMPSIGPANLAYVIYTSGSTGKPKGVEVEHRGLGNLAALQAAAFDVTPESRVLQFSSTNFDASVWEIVMALLNGATLVLAPQDALLPGPDLLRTLADQAVSIATLPPSALAATPPSALPALRTLVVAGEACAEDLVSRWAPGRRFVNAYGPTEATVCATMTECVAGGGKPSIGGPIANVEVHVLDAAGIRAPIGVPGELVIGGAGLARGYLNRPDLTAQKFFQSPFGSGRLYRTGDLARWLPDGTIEYLGRIDHQVKIRGFRIELGEIEAALMQHSAIRDAAVIARDDRPGKRLVAYVVAEDAVSAADLRAFLATKLPEYMVPAAYVTLTAMPLTPNGKVDWRALPAPEASGAAERVAPKTDTEKALAQIWCEVLAIDAVGATDNFFELGGHSLLATSVMGRIATALAIELPLQALFEAPTVAGLAEAVDAARWAAASQRASADTDDLEEGVL